MFLPHIDNFTFHTHWPQAFPSPLVSEHNWTFKNSLPLETWLHSLLSQKAILILVPSASFLLQLNYIHVLYSSYYYHILYIIYKTLRIFNFCHVSWAHLQHPLHFLLVHKLTLLTLWPFIEKFSWDLVLDCRLHEVRKIFFVLYFCCTV